MDKQPAPATTLKQAWEQGFYALDDAVNPYDEDDETEDDKSDRLGVLILCVLIVLVVAGAFAASYFGVGGVE